MLPLTRGALPGLPGFGLFLVAGKVVAKTGLLLVVLAFLKKGIVLVLVPVMWRVNKLRGKGPKA